MSEQTHTHIVLASPRSVETFFSPHRQYCRLATPTAVVPTCPQTGGLWDLRFFIAAGLTLWAPLNLSSELSLRHLGMCLCVYMCVCTCACVCVHTCVLSLHCSRRYASEFLVSGVVLSSLLSKHLGHMWCDFCGYFNDRMNYLENARKKLNKYNSIERKSKQNQKKYGFAKLSADPQMRK